MSFKLLKKIISHLRKKEVCPYCKNSFPEDLVFVLATAGDPISGTAHGLFFIVCEPCHAAAFAYVEVSRVTARKESIRVQTKPASSTISTDEILDMHNFLKDWKGDVAELFKSI